MRRQRFFIVMMSLFITTSASFVHSQSQNYYWMKIKATDKFSRSIVASTGVAIENIKEDYVIAYGSESELTQIKNLGLLIASSNLQDERNFNDKNGVTSFDFPDQDDAYHNYDELTEALTKIANQNPNLVKMFSIGKSTENRDIWALRIGTDQSHASEKPGIIYMGGHHAREHLSVEMPLMFAEYLVTEFNKNNPRITSLLNTRDIHIIPIVNPDGSEFDIADGRYKAWRKNRSRNSNGTYGTDLNRNYGYQWGTGGSSSNPSSDTFKGTAPFSEPETVAIKNYIESNINISTLLSFHTYSQLILYPWGHSYSSIENKRDLLVHETMAKKMAEWNKYTPQQSSDLYIASGDTTDWSYGVHKIISFTFELDPSGAGFGSGGFYPGADVIQPVFQKNLEPYLYLLEYADNPYRVLNIGIGPIKP